MPVSWSRPATMSPSRTPASGCSATTTCAGRWRPTPGADSWSCSRFVARSTRTRRSTGNSPTAPCTSWSCQSHRRPAPGDAPNRVRVSGGRRASPPAATPPRPMAGPAWRRGAPRAWPRGAWEASRRGAAPASPPTAGRACPAYRGGRMKTPPSAIMPTARSVALDPTRDYSAEMSADEAGAALLAARDPLDDLVDRVRPVASAAVDALQVAAALEADGITDRSAQVQYGFGDVFALAAEVHRRTAPTRSSTGSAPGRARQWLAGLRDVGHGVLYLLPAAVFPAVLAVLGRRALLLGLVVAGAVGWVCAGAAAWLAYRLLGRNHPGGSGRVVLPWALGVGIASTALTFALALGQTTGRAADSETGVRDGLRGELRMLAPVVLYTGLSALYLLHAQAPYLLSRFDVAVAVVPLMLGMGAVEWRARRFGEQARTLLHRVRYPSQLVPRIWLLLLAGLLVCLTAVALLAVAVFAVLRSSLQLSPASVLMALACVVLAGAYYLGFLLANMGRYGWLCWSLALCMAIHLAVVAAARLTRWQADPVVDTSAFLGSTVLLAVLFLSALGSRVAEARVHR